MKRKNFMLTAAAAAVLGAFNPAFAQDSSTSTGVSNTDVNAGANTSPGVNVGSGDQNASTNEAGSSAQGSTSGDASVTASNEEDEERHSQGKARGHDEERAKGLDRADQAAGEQDEHGRDIARERQGG
jgi:hypothetical protein